MDRGIVGPGRYLFATFWGGGNVQPTVGLAGRLVARGHAVRVVAPQRLRSRLEAVGCSYRPFPPGLEFDPPPGVALEDEFPAFVEMLIAGPLAEAVVAEHDRDPADALVIDCMLRNALAAAERIARPTAVLVHTTYRYWMASDPASWERSLANANRSRMALGLKPRALGPLPPYLDVWSPFERILMLLPSEFDDLPLRTPNGSVRYIGPVFEGEATAAWDLPWPAGHPDPLVVVSFSTSYMHQEALLVRVAEALEGLGVRVLVTLGEELAPERVTLPPEVVVRRYVPHAAVLPHAALVVTHAGMGTVMAALAHGVPLLCLPMGRDQPLVARRVEELGSGRVLAPEASVPEVRGAVVELLASEATRDAAQRMARTIAAYRAGALAVDELEGLLRSPSATGARR